MKEAVERLDSLMTTLVNADQTGAGIEPMKVAAELGKIRELFYAAPTVVRRAEGGQKHFRCESCGTISHGEDAPAKCPECGSTGKFFVADLSQPNVESGAG